MAFQKTFDDNARESLRAQVMQEQDAQALLQHACDEFAYDLYHPVFQFQHSE